MANWNLSRRTFLRGAGVTMSLPLLDAMMPNLARGASAPATPRRLAYLYVPNGKNMPEWKPTTEGANFELPKTLEALAPFRYDFNVLSGLSLNTAKGNGDGPGDHARSVASFLTGRQARKTFGKDIRAGISADQVVAQSIGHQTRFSSLELGAELGRMAGNCDSGYSCAYSSNISWRTESTPNPKEANPRVIFDRLFGFDSSQSGSNDFRGSILDFVQEDAKRLDRNLGRTDRRKLDEYTSAVRELEQRIQTAPLNGSDIESQLPKGVMRPKGTPGDFGEHLRLLGDLMVLAFQLDLTRVTTFMFADEGSNRSYPSAGVKSSHHEVSHHDNDPEKIEKIGKINRFHVQQLAYIVEKMKSIKEGNSTLLDNMMLVYGSGIADGDAHAHRDLPILLIGRGGGTIDTGRHINYGETPLMNLHLALIDRMGVAANELGDSTGKLDQLKL